ncbi:MAG: Mor transcription activator family protein [Angelakisella sp.]|nr:Mor transcription activator family protein [Angelakisella sp.]
MKEKSELGLYALYLELSQLVGYDNMMKLYTYYKGQQLNFPVRLYSKQYILDILSSEYDGSNARELARKTGYSERWVRCLIKQHEIGGQLK